jgi:hypothetical protein
VQGTQKNVGKRSVTWTADVEGDRDPVTGKRKQHKKTFRTQREAKDWRTKTLHELRSGVYVESTTATLTEYLDQRLATVEPNVQPATYDRY